jgi:tRNA G10  N-methylase Trm11
VIPNKTPELSTAQVLHNKLTTLGAWELLLVRQKNQVILAQTMFVQDIEAYAARDQTRPYRDAKVGMLPPKLAQIIVNLAVGQSKPSDKAITILDPFCGTGVLLQEALLDGYGVMGTDIDPKMIDYSRKNIDWLQSSFGFKGSLRYLEAADATKAMWASADGLDIVASETYLGAPLHSPLPLTRLQPIIQEVDTLLSKFLKNIGGQLPAGTRLALAVPAWRVGNGFEHLPLLDRLTDMGYNRLSFKHASNEDLIYWREGQLVARELVVLEKKP